LFGLAQGASLTIFSEDGDKFTLYLNAVQQNQSPQANLRVDGLSQAFYNATVVFEDAIKGKLKKNIPVNDPATNAPSDVVYKIKSKDGEMKLRYFSAQPAQATYTPAPEVYVIHYGQPDPGTTTVRQTTISTTTGYGDGNVSITPITTTQTTTTTTTEFGYGAAPPPPDTRADEPHRRHEHGRCEYPMDWNSFKSAKATISETGFDETKLSTAKSIIAANCLSTEQVVQICQLFSFEDNKLQFAKDAYARTTDPGNYFKVTNVFSFDASKTDLNNFITSHQR